MTKQEIQAFYNNEPNKSGWKLSAIKDLLKLLEEK